MSIPSLLDILLPPEKLKLVPPGSVEQYRFKYYDGEGRFKGTNDEVIGWNSRRPAWFGFVTKAGNRWYVHRGDLTPESLELALKELEEKEKAKAERSRQCKEREEEKAKTRGEQRRLRVASSYLDGREDEIRALLRAGNNISRAAMALGIARNTLMRKLETMENE